MSERIIMRTGEALVAGGPAGTAAEPEIIIGELDGPVGTAIATLTGDQVQGHTRVFAILNTDIQVRPVTLMVSKVTVKNSRYTNILMGTVQAAIANGVLDAVRAGDIPKEKANDLGIICSVWLNPSVIKDDNLDHQILFDIHRQAMAKAIHKAMTNTPDIDWLLENQDKITHKYFQMGLDGKI
ncbi:formaldehyde-activating enzyme [Methylomonas methanica]|uniref:Aldehyde-activating protein n=1 Tax=Methylomonas methanica TaxID=421 RepID=A0A177LYB2_METMH|nr:formaldehyde-activating enzyme [Methylomonas methanica]OAH97919.1 aldehyde-activating protein [Methylomonas methanica]OAI03143.1 aldehyde-activating protein [Methylomonas methanica]